MSSDKKNQDTSERGPAANGKAAEPDWANGLKQLYDSVVEEELPDSFKDLLAKLDAAPDEGGKGA